VILTASLCALGLAGCSDAGADSGGNAGTTTAAPTEAAGGGNNTEAAQPATDLKKIFVISREEGSGTVGAFVELFGVQQKDADGNNVDYTTLDAEITNSTSVVMSTVEGNRAAIGYISLGSLGDQVKALKIDGNIATTENVKNGSYKISRPFNIVTGSSVGALAQDFIDFILSDEGQKVVEENYISEGSSGAYGGALPSGKITVAGSSSVEPLMQKLKEAYVAVNPNADIEIQKSDSTTGINNTIDGICDIGMASRELKESEEASVSGTTIAIDGIAVIVNTQNPVDDLTAEQVREIYTGEITDWSEVS